MPHVVKQTASAQIDRRSKKQAKRKEEEKQRPAGRSDKGDSVRIKKPNKPACAPRHDTTHAPTPNPAIVSSHPQRLQGKKRYSKKARLIKPNVGSRTQQLSSSISSSSSSKGIFWGKVDMTKSSASVYTTRRARTGGYQNAPQLPAHLDARLDIQKTKNKIKHKEKKATSTHICPPCPPIIYQCLKQDH